MKVMWAFDYATGMGGLAIDGTDEEKAEHLRSSKRVRDAVLTAIPDALQDGGFLPDGETQIHVALACLQYAAQMFVDTNGSREVWLAFCRQSAELSGMKTLENIVTGTDAGSLVH